MNGDVPAMFALAILIGLVALTTWLALVQVMALRLTETYQRAADQFHGKAERATWRRYPRLTFEHEQLGVVVEVEQLGGHHKRYVTQMRVDWPDNFFTCQIQLHGYFDRLGALLGKQDLQIGSPHFDQTYRIDGNDLQRIRQLLSGSVQARIDVLRRYRNEDISLRWEGGYFILRKQEIYRSFDELQAFLLLGLSIVDAALATRCEGIEFVGALQPATDRAGELCELPADQIVTCRICGESIPHENAVFCQRCHTPHHAECWSYYGACSVYGCGCRQIVKRWRAGGRSRKSR